MPEIDPGSKMCKHPISCYQVVCCKDQRLKQRWEENEKFRAGLFGALFAKKLCRKQEQRKKLKMLTFGPWASQINRKLIRFIHSFSFHFFLVRAMVAGWEGQSSHRFQLLLRGSPDIPRMTERYMLWQKVSAPLAITPMSFFPRLLA